MPTLSADFHLDRRPDGAFALHLTPAEWRAFLEDPDFLDDPDNSFARPRRLMGLLVEIVPDHTFG